MVPCMPCSSPLSPQVSFEYPLFYQYLWLALRQAKPVTPILLNILGENVEGERFWKIQN